LAELIDDDCGIGKIVVAGRRPLEQATEQRRFTGTEKAGQHRKRKQRRRTRGIARRHCVSVLGAIWGGGLGEAATAGLVLAPEALGAACSVPGQGLSPVAALAGLGTAAVDAGFAAGSAACAGFAGAGFAVGGLAVAGFAATSIDPGFFFAAGTAAAGGPDARPVRAGPV